MPHQALVPRSLSGPNFISKFEIDFLTRSQRLNLGGRSYYRTFARLREYESTYSVAHHDQLPRDHSEIVTLLACSSCPKIAERRPRTRGQH